ncbi:putative phage tail assembly chaperone [Desulfovibrio subterraneus]|uniref:putative phage tail assembly chaperone n=1 Tax=Desulfovibrio subterraneus TaxID=2718620 RepID=UPI0022B8598D|nr:putative phage tail assembly chaperone [Desulfovibrio subterraneus]WBF68255.1 putative phage tail assembly chaperone [Desulfovibrio subterraneus]
METANKIVLTIQGRKVTFAPSLDIYNDYINAMMPNNKVAPARNFVMRCVDAEDKDHVRELLDKPGAPIQIAGAIMEQYTPDLQITVGE